MICCIRLNRERQVTVFTDLGFRCASIGFRRYAPISCINRIARSSSRNGNRRILYELNFYGNILVQAINGQGVGEIVLHCDTQGLHISPGNRCIIHRPFCNHVVGRGLRRKHQFRTGRDIFCLVCFQVQVCAILDRGERTVFALYPIADSIADRLVEDHGHSMICCHVAQRVSILVCTVGHRMAVQLPGLHMVILVRVRRKGQVGSGCYCDRAAAAARCCHCTIFRSFRRIRYRIALRIRHTDRLNVVLIDRRSFRLSVGNRPCKGCARFRLFRPIHSPVVKLVTVCWGCCEGNVRAAANVSAVFAILGSRNPSVCTFPSNRILHLLEAHGDGRAYRTCCLRCVGKRIAGFALLYAIDQPLLHFIACLRFCRDFNAGPERQFKTSSKVGNLCFPQLHTCDTSILPCAKGCHVAKRRKLNRHLSIFRRH